MMRGAVTEFVVTVLTNLVQLCTQASGLSIAVLSTAKLFSSTCARLWGINYKIRITLAQTGKQMYQSSLVKNHQGHKSQVLMAMSKCNHAVCWCVV